MALRRLIAALAACLFAAAMAGSARAAETQSYERRFIRGAGRVVEGVCLELPKTVIRETLRNPPVVGALVGLLAGTARALQTTVAGLVDMAAGLKPIGSEKAR